MNDDLIYDNLFIHDVDGAVIIKLHEIRSISAGKKIADDVSARDHKYNIELSDSGFSTRAVSYLKDNDWNKLRCTQLSARWEASYVVPDYVNGAF